MKGGSFDENQIRQDIMENHVHSAWYHDSDESTTGDFIAANTNILRYTVIANSLYYSVSGVNVQNIVQGQSMSKAELARELGVSRTYVTLLTQGKRNPSKRIVDRLAQLKLTANVTVNTGTHEHLTFNQGVGWPMLID